MRIVLAFLLTAGLLGCTAGTFQVPQDEFRQQVRTLGVAPVMVDARSTITHPERSEVVALLRRHSSAREERLIDMLKEERGFFDIRRIPERPRELFDDLVKGRSLADEAEGAQYTYSFDRQAVQRISEQYRIDGLLMVILNGVERQEKRWDRTRMNYLEAPYNSIVATAMVVGRSGEILWEFAPEEVFLSLQYPDFDEAYHNKMEAVRLKYITLDGLERTLAEPRGGIVGHSAFPRVYYDLFKKISEGLKPGFINPLRKSGGSETSADTKD